MKIKNKLSKKLLCKIFLCLLMLIFMGFAAIHLALAYILPLDSVRNKIISTLEEQLATDVNIKSISASLFDFAVDGLEIKIKDNDFIYIDKAYIHFSLRKLLAAKLKTKRITINNLTLYVEKDENGKFNFDELINNAPAFAKKEEEAQQPKKQKEDEDKDQSVIDLFLHKTQLQNFSILYIDKQANINAKLTNLFFNIDDFNFIEPFKINFYTNIYALANGIEIDSANLACTMTIKLNPNELDKANIDINKITLNYKDTTLLVQGNVNNLVKPNITLDINLKDLSQKLLEGIVEVPEFFVPLINIKTNLTTDIEKSKIDLHSLNVNVLDSTISADGYLDYSNMTYKFNVIINLILEKLHSVTKLIEEYKPAGQINSQMLISNKEIKGNLVLNNVCAYVEQLGNFTDINSTIYINSINDIKIPELKGVLNKYPFKANLSYLLAEKYGDIVIGFKADKFIGKQAKTTKKEEPKKTAEPSQENKKEEQTNPLPPFHIKANCNVNFLDIPYLRANKVAFDMDLSNVSPSDLTDIKGYLKLDSQNGLIKDIYKLTEANALTKGLFLSLKIISDVINALNVLDLLSSIGSVFSSTDEATKENEDIVKHQKIDGQMEFTSFLTKLNFLNGKADFDKCSFVSSLLSFRVTGNMNFKENTIKMTVFTAPGEHKVDEIMPLTMKIGGTMDEPSGSLSLLGSVSSLVGDMLTKNVVSNKLKKGFSALFGLKKNDEQGNEIKEDTNISTTTAVSTTTVSK